MSKIALLFPGQGAQYTGMGKAFFDDYSIVRETFEEAGEALGINLAKICFENYGDQLLKTENTQPAILTLSTAMFRVYMDRFGIEPTFVAGHSLGEFTALTCSGAMSFFDAVMIVQKRGKLMQEAGKCIPGAMLAISGFRNVDVEEECHKLSKEDKLVVISNYNSKDQIVVSGDVDSIIAIRENVEKYGAKVTPLKVSAAFHSPLMKSAIEGLKHEIGKYKLSKPKWPVISNVTAKPYTKAEELIENLTLQLTSPVRWMESMKFLREENINLVIELGPGKVLKGLMRKNANSINAYSYDHPEDVLKLTEVLDELIFRTNVINRCLASAISTKNQNFNLKEYDEGVIEPYKKLQAIYEKYKVLRCKPLKEDMIEALEQLKIIFNTKRVPINEQIERYNQILSETGTKELFNDFEVV